MRIFSLFLLLAFFGLAESVCPSCQQQCSCSKPVSSKPCMGYDNRYMASSIDEAMFSFPNLVSTQGKPLFDKSNPPPPGGSDSIPMGGFGIMSGPVPPESAQSAKVAPAIASVSAAIPETPAKSVNRFTAPSAQGDCTSQECLSCKLSIVDGFIGDSQPNENDELWVTKVRLQKETGLSAGTCGNAENAPTPTTTTKRPPKEEKLKKENEKRVQQVVSILTTFGRKKRQIPKLPDLPEGNYTNKTQNIIDSLLGVTTQIGCDYRRGSALNSESSWSGLCNLCWQWRRLPDEYFPNYVNEVNCDRNDCGCLSGFGTCMPVTRILNVLKNTGTAENPNWQDATIDTIAACECQVEMTNPLHPFVSK